MRHENLKRIFIGLMVVYFFAFDAETVQAGWWKDRFCWINCQEIKKVKTELEALKKKVNDLENGVKTAEQTGRETTRAIGTLTSGADATKRDVDGLRKMHIELDKKVDKMLGATRSATANQTKSREFKLWYLTGNEVSNFSEIRKVVGSPQDSNGNAAAEIFAIRYYTKNLKKAWEVITEHAIKMQRAGIRLPDDWRPEPMAPDAQFGEEALVIVIKSFMESGS